MMDNESRHFREEIQEFLDGRLGSSAQAALEVHLQDCDSCRRELAVLREVKRFAKDQFAAGPLPPGLEARLRGVLDQEDRAAIDKPSPADLWSRRNRPILAYGFLLFVAVVLVFNYFIKFPTLPSEVANDFRSYQRGDLPVQLETVDFRAMEQYFAARGVPFPTRVFDLGMMNYRLVGGRVHQLVNRKSALFVYQSDPNKLLVCQMYPGNVSELPPSAETRQDRGFTFHIYHQNGLTAVFWQERDITCVLVSDISPEQVLQLAMAKAMI
jgi:anti-sigma factor RsiW